MALIDEEPLVEPVVEDFTRDEPPVTVDPNEGLPNIPSLDDFRSARDTASAASTSRTAVNSEMQVFQNDELLPLWDSQMDASTRGDVPDKHKFQHLDDHFNAGRGDEKATKQWNTVTRDRYLEIQNKQFEAERAYSEAQKSYADVKRRRNDRTEKQKIAQRRLEEQRRRKNVPNDLGYNRATGDLTSAGTRNAGAAFDMFVELNRSHYYRPQNKLLHNAEEKVIAQGGIVSDEGFSAGFPIGTSPEARKINRTVIEEGEEAAVEKHGDEAVYQAEAEASFHEAVLVARKADVELQKALTTDDEDRIETAVENRELAQEQLAMELETAKKDGNLHKFGGTPQNSHSLSLIEEASERVPEGKASFWDYTKATAAMGWEKVGSATDSSMFSLGIIDEQYYVKKERERILRNSKRHGDTEGYVNNAIDLKNIVWDAENGETLSQRAAGLGEFATHVLVDFAASYLPIMAATQVGVALPAKKVAGGIAKAREKRGLTPGKFAKALPGFGQVASFFAASAYLEQGSMIENMQKIKHNGRKVDIFNDRAVLAAFEDPEWVHKLKTATYGRAAIIGAIDALTMAIGGAFGKMAGNTVGKFTSKMPIGDKVIPAIAEKAGILGGDMFAGGLGETLGQAWVWNTQDRPGGTFAKLVRSEHDKQGVFGWTVDGYADLNEIAMEALSGPVVALSQEAFGSPFHGMRNMARLRDQALMGEEMTEAGAEAVRDEQLEASEMGRKVAVTKQVDYIETGDTVDGTVGTVNDGRGREYTYHTYAERSGLVNAILKRFRKSSDQRLTNFLDGFFSSLEQGDSQAFADLKVVYTSNLNMSQEEHADTQGFYDTENNILYLNTDSTVAGGQANYGMRLSTATQTTGQGKSKRVTEANNLASVLVHEFAHIAEAYGIVDPQTIETEFAILDRKIKDKEGKNVGQYVAYLNYNEAAAAEAAKSDAKWNELRDAFYSNPEIQRIARSEWFAMQMSRVARKSVQPDTKGVAGVVEKLINKLRPNVQAMVGTKKLTTKALDSTIAEMLDPANRSSAVPTLPEGARFFNEDGRESVPPVIRAGGAPKPATTPSAPAATPTTPTTPTTPATPQPTTPNAQAGGGKMTQEGDLEISPDAVKDIEEINKASSEKVTGQTIRTALESVTDEEARSLGVKTVLNRFRKRPTQINKEVTKLYRKIMEGREKGAEKVAKEENRKRINAERKKAFKDGKSPRKGSKGTNYWVGDIKVKGDIVNIRRYDDGTEEVLFVSFQNSESAFHKGEPIWIPVEDFEIEGTTDKAIASKQATFERRLATLRKHAGLEAQRPENRNQQEEEEEEAPQSKDSPPQSKDSPPQSKDSPPQSKDSPPQSKDSPPPQKAEPVVIGEYKLNPEAEALLDKLGMNNAYHLTHLAEHVSRRTLDGLRGEINKKPGWLLAKRIARVSNAGFETSEHGETGESYGFFGDRDDQDGVVYSGSWEFGQAGFRVGFFVNSKSEERVITFDLERQTYDVLDTSNHSVFDVKPENVKIRAKLEEFIGDDFVAELEDIAASLKGKDGPILDGTALDVENRLHHAFTRHFDFHLGSQWTVEEGGVSDTGHVKEDAEITRKSVAYLEEAPGKYAIVNSRLVPDTGTEGIAYDHKVYRLVNAQGVETLVGEPELNLLVKFRDNPGRVALLRKNEKGIAYIREGHKLSKFDESELIPARLHGRIPRNLQRQAGEMLADAQQELAEAIKQAEAAVDAAQKSEANEAVEQAAEKLEETKKAVTTSKPKPPSKKPTKKPPVKKPAKKTTAKKPTRKPPAKKPKTKRIKNQDGLPVTAPTPAELLQTITQQDVEDYIFAYRLPEPPKERGYQVNRDAFQLLVEAGLDTPFGVYMVREYVKNQKKVKKSRAGKNRWSPATLTAQHVNSFTNSVARRVQEKKRVAEKEKKNTEVAKKKSDTTSTNADKNPSESNQTKAAETHNDALMQQVLELQKQQQATLDAVVEILGQLVGKMGTSPVQQQQQTETQEEAEQAEQKAQQEVQKELSGKKPPPPPPPPPPKKEVKITLSPKAKKLADEANIPLGDYAAWAAEHGRKGAVENPRVTDLEAYLAAVERGDHTPVRSRKFVVVEDGKEKVVVPVALKSLPTITLTESSTKSKWVRDMHKQSGEKFNMSIAAWELAEELELSYEELEAVHIYVMQKENAVRDANNKIRSTDLAGLLNEVEVEQMMEMRRMVVEIAGKEGHVRVGDYVMVYDTQTGRELMLEPKRVTGVQIDKNTGEILGYTVEGALYKPEQIEKRDIELEMESDGDFQDTQEAIRARKERFQRYKSKINNKFKDKEGDLTFIDAVEVGHGIYAALYGVGAGQKGKRTYTRVIYFVDTKVRGRKGFTFASKARNKGLTMPRTNLKQLATKKVPGTYKINAGQQFHFKRRKWLRNNTNAEVTIKEGFLEESFSRPEAPGLGEAELVVSGARIHTLISKQQWEKLSDITISEVLEFFGVEVSEDSSEKRRDALEVEWRRVTGKASNDFTARVQFKKFLAESFRTGRRVNLTKRKTTSRISVAEIIEAVEDSDGTPNRNVTTFAMREFLKRLGVPLEGKSRMSHKDMWAMVEAIVRQKKEWGKRGVTDLEAFKTEDFPNSAKAEITQTVAGRTQWTPLEVLQYVKANGLQATALHRGVPIWIVRKLIREAGLERYKAPEGWVRGYDRNLRMLVEFLDTGSTARVQTDFVLENGNLIQFETALEKVLYVYATAKKGSKQHKEAVAYLENWENLSTKEDRDAWASGVVGAVRDMVNVQFAKDETKSTEAAVQDDLQHLELLNNRLKVLHTDLAKEEAKLANLKTKKGQDKKEREIRVIQKSIDDVQGKVEAVSKRITVYKAEVARERKNTRGTPANPKKRTVMVHWKAPLRWTPHEGATVIDRGVRRPMLDVVKELNAGGVVETELAAFIRQTQQFYSTLNGKDMSDAVRDNWAEHLVDSQDQGVYYEGMTELNEASARKQAALDMAPILNRTYTDLSKSVSLQNTRAEVRHSVRGMKAEDPNTVEVKRDTSGQRITLPALQELAALQSIVGGEQTTKKSSPKITKQDINSIDLAIATKQKKLEEAEYLADQESEKSDRKRKAGRRALHIAKEIEALQNLRKKLETPKHAGDRPEGFLIGATHRSNTKNTDYLEVAERVLWWNRVLNDLDNTGVHEGDIINIDEGVTDRRSFSREEVYGEERTPDMELTTVEPGDVVTEVTHVSKKAIQKTFWDIMTKYGLKPGNVAAYTKGGAFDTQHQLNAARSSAHALIEIQKNTSEALAALGRTTVNNPQAKAALGKVTAFFQNLSNTLDTEGAKPLPEGTMSASPYAAQMLDGLQNNKPENLREVAKELNEAARATPEAKSLKLLAEHINEFSNTHMERLEDAFGNLEGISADARTAAQLPADMKPLLREVMTESPNDIFILRAKAMYFAARSVAPTLRYGQPAFARYDMFRLNGDRDTAEGWDTLQMAMDAVSFGSLPMSHLLLDTRRDNQPLFGVGGTLKGSRARHVEAALLNLDFSRKAWPQVLARHTTELLGTKGAEDFLTILEHAWSPDYSSMDNMATALSIYSQWTNGAPLSAPMKYWKPHTIRTASRTFAAVPGSPVYRNSGMLEYDTLPANAVNGSGILATSFGGTSPARLANLAKLFTAEGALAERRTKSGTPDSLVLGVTEALEQIHKHGDARMEAVIGGAPARLLAKGITKAIRQTGGAFTRTELQDIAKTAVAQKLGKPVAKVDKLDEKEIDKFFKQLGIQPSRFTEALRKAQSESLASKTRDRIASDAKGTFQAKTAILNGKKMHRDEYANNKALNAIYRDTRGYMKDPTIVGNLGRDYYTKGSKAGAKWAEESHQDAETRIKKEGMVVNPEALRMPAVRDYYEYDAYIPETKNLVDMAALHTQMPPANTTIGEGLNWVMRNTKGEYVRRLAKFLKRAIGPDIAKMPVVYREYVYEDVVHAEQTDKSDASLVEVISKDTKLPSALYVRDAGILVPYMRAEEAQKVDRPTVPANAITVSTFLHEVIHPLQYAKMKNPEAGFDGLSLISSVLSEIGSAFKNHVEYVDNGGYGPQAHYGLGFGDGTEMFNEFEFMVEVLTNPMLAAYLSTFKINRSDENTLWRTAPNGGAYYAAASFDMGEYGQSNLAVWLRESLGVKHDSWLDEIVSITHSYLSNVARELEGKPKVKDTHLYAKRISGRDTTPFKYSGKYDPKFTTRSEQQRYLYDKQGIKEHLESGKNLATREAKSARLYMEDSTYWLNDVPPEIISGIDEAESVSLGMAMPLADTTMKDGLQWIAKNIKTPGVKNLAKLLLERTEGMDVKFVHKQRVARKGKMVSAGEYDISTETITGFYLVKENQDSFEVVRTTTVKTFLHEVIHAATMSTWVTKQGVGYAYLQRVNPFMETITGLEIWKELKELHDDFIGQFNKDYGRNPPKGKPQLIPTKEPGNTDETPYGLTDVTEFVTEALTNPRFQLLLAQYESRRPSKSMLSVIVDFVQKILRIPPRDRTLLDDVITLTDEIMMETQKDRYQRERGKLQKLVREGYLDAVEASERFKEQKEIIDRHQYQGGIKANPFEDREMQNGWMGEYADSDLIFAKRLGKYDGEFAGAPKHETAVTPSIGSRARGTMGVWGDALEFFQDDSLRWADRLRGTQTQLVDPFRRKLQDRAVTLRRLGEDVEREMGVWLPETSDAYVMHDLHTGKVGNDIDYIDEYFVKPLQDLINTHQLNIDVLDEWAILNHAKERNAIIRTKTKGRNQKGSGFTDAEVDQEIINYRMKYDTDKYDLALDILHQMNRWALDMRYQHQVISKDTYDTLKQKYPKYVPLRGFAEESSYFDDTSTLDESRLSTGQGVSQQRNRGLRKTVGLALDGFVNDVTAWSIALAKQAAVEARKNEVMLSFHELVERAGKLGHKIAIPYSPPKETQLTVSGKKIQVPIQGWRDNKGHILVGVMINGVMKPYQVASDRHDGGSSLAMLLNNVNPSKVNQILQGFMRWRAAMNTTLSPVFALRNFIRDYQAARIALEGVGEELGSVDPKSFSKEVQKEALDMKNLAGAFAGGVLALSKGHSMWDGKSNRANKWKAEFERYRAAGGKIHFYKMDTLEETARQLSKGLDMSKKTPLDAIKYLWNTASNYNGAVENALRLSVFKVLVSKGVSEQQAATVTRNLTVNFNRRGEWGAAISSNWLFGNASIQGSATMMKKLRMSRAVKGTAMRIFTAGFIISVINRMIAGLDDDEENYWDSVAPWDKYHNTMILNPLEKDTPVGEVGSFKVPLPYGWNVFYAAGVMAEDSVFGKKKNPSAQMGAFISLTAQAFNPLGATDNPALGMVPEYLRFPAEVFVFNEDYKGAPVVPNDYGSKEKPNYGRYYPSVSGISRALTEFAAEAGGAYGGEDGRKGHPWLDISPEVLDHFASYVAGGSGQFVWRSGEFVLDTPRKGLDLSESPFSRVFIGGKPDYYDVGAYYELAKHTRASTDLVLNAGHTTIRDPERRREARQYEKKVKLFHNRVIRPADAKLARLRKVLDSHLELAKTNKLTLTHIEELREKYHADRRSIILGALNEAAELGIYPR